MLYTWCTFHQVYISILIVKLIDKLVVYLNGLWITVICAFFNLLFMKFHICEHILFRLIRWSCVTGHAPHAAPGLGAGRSQSSSPCPPAACLLVSGCLAHTLLFPALPSDGVHGESKPGATQNGPEQREVGPGAPLPLQAALISTWWPYSYTYEVGETT